MLRLRVSCWYLDLACPFSCLLFSFIFLGFPSSYFIRVAETHARDDRREEGRRPKREEASHENTEEKKIATAG